MIPKHVAIIMDGNGRWAQQRGHPRIYGHLMGSRRVREIVRECGRLGVGYLTLFCFSSENWGRPKEEISLLMKILIKYLVREQKTLIRENVRFRAIGELERLPPEVLKIVQNTEALTSHHTGLQLVFALSYGGRQDIINAVRSTVSDVADRLKTQDKSFDLASEIASITEDSFAQKLFGPDIPDPDLMIRTSGEQRISNFLLWQCAYSEFVFTETLWPDFGVTELEKAFGEYSRRTRRFGLTDAQLHAQEAST